MLGRRVFPFIDAGWSVHHFIAASTDLFRTFRVIIFPTSIN